jgi:hypothetical protein
LPMRRPGLAILGASVTDNTTEPNNNESIIGFQASQVFGEARRKRRNIRAIRQGRSTNPRAEWKTWLDARRLSTSGGQPAVCLTRTLGGLSRLARKRCDSARGTRSDPATDLRNASHASFTKSCAAASLDFARPANSLLTNRPHAPDGNLWPTVLS